MFVFSGMLCAWRSSQSFEKEKKVSSILVKWVKYLLVESRFKYIKVVGKFKYLNPIGKAPGVRWENAAQFALNPEQQIA